MGLSKLIVFGLVLTSPCAYADVKCIEKASAEIVELPNIPVGKRGQNLSVLIAAKLCAGKKDVRSVQIECLKSTSDEIFRRTEVSSDDAGGETAVLAAAELCK